MYTVYRIKKHKAAAASQGKKMKADSLASQWSHNASLKEFR
jgi:hypothetical protein